LLGHEGFGLGLSWVRSEVELIGGVQVVAGDEVGVRSVVGDDLLAGPTRSESLRMGLAGVVEAAWEVLVEWGVRTRWLDSRLARDGPRRRRVRVGVRSKLKVGVLVVERNFANFPVSSPVTTSGSITSPVLGLGVMVRRSWKDPAPSAVHTQDPKTKVSPRLKAATGLMRTEAVEFAMRSSVRAPTWCASYRCFRPATYQGEYPR
jgi:hypothetical protein